MRQLWCGVLVLAVVVVGAPGRARAECVEQFMEASPSLDAAPLKGSVFTYFGLEDLGRTPEDYPNIELPPPPRVPMPTGTWSQGSGRTSVTRLSPRVFRTDYEGIDGALLSVSGSRLTLSSSATPFKVPHITTMDRQRRDDGCPRWNYLRIVLDGNVAALRAHWSRAGESADHWLVDTHGHDFRLGTASCGPSNLDPRELDAGGHLQLFAIAPDGSEHLIFDDDVSTAMFDPSYRARAAASPIAALLALLALMAACVVGVPAVALHGIRGRGHGAKPLPRARRLRRP